MKATGAQVKWCSVQSKVDRLNWNCENADTRYLTHGIHRYSGKFIPQIARQALEIVSGPGQTILDPYCGSGTTLLEAELLRRRAIGIDMNPLAVLIAKVKCTPIPDDFLNTVECQLNSFVRIMEESPEVLPLFKMTPCRDMASRINGDPRWEHEWYRKWFDEDGLRQLIPIHQEILSISRENLRNAALVAFSDILRRCSHARGGYPNVMYDKRRPRRPLPARLFVRRLHDVFERVKELGDREMWCTPAVNLGDARQTGLDDQSVDAIVTHPPYIGSVPYAEYGVLSLTWLGYQANELDKRLTGGRRQSPHVIQRFTQEYSEMLNEAWRVLKPGTICFLMVGNPLVKGRRVDLRKMSLDLSSSIGFKLVAEAKRAGVNRRANQMGDESLLFLGKG